MHCSIYFSQCVLNRAVVINCMGLFGIIPFPKSAERERESTNLLFQENWIKV